LVVSYILNFPALHLPRREICLCQLLRSWYSKARFDCGHILQVCIEQVWSKRTTHCAYRVQNLPCGKKFDFEGDRIRFVLASSKWASEDELNVVRNISGDGCLATCRFCCAVQRWRSTTNKNRNTLRVSRTKHRTSRRRHARFSTASDPQYWIMMPVIRHTLPLPSFLSRG
jgi:hypothetical protein